MLKHQLFESFEIWKSVLSWLLDITKIIIEK